MGRSRNPERDHRLSALDESLLLLLRTRGHYGLALLTALQEVTGRCLSVGSLYPTLHALERKGLLRSWWGEDVSEDRGHARRRYYRTTAAGEAALARVEDQRHRLAHWPESCHRQDASLHPA